MYHVSVCIHEHTSLYNASQALTGLCALAERGQATVRWTSQGFAAPQAAVVQLTVSGPATAPPRRVVLDLLDRSDLVDSDALAACDVYFKRSYFAPHLTQLFEQSQCTNRQKVRPWGLNFPCRGPALKRQTWPLLWRTFLQRAARASLRNPRALRSLAQEARQFLCLPSAAQFEVSEHQPLEPAIVFQTRLWEPEEAAPDDAREVNRLRVDLVRALRRALGRA